MPVTLDHDPAPVNAAARRESPTPPSTHTPADADATAAHLSLLRSELHGVRTELYMLRVEHDQYCRSWLQTLTLIRRKVAGSGTIALAVATGVVLGGLALAMLALLLSAAVVALI